MKEDLNGTHHFIELLEEQGGKLDRVESVLETGFDRIAQELKLTRIDNAETRSALIDSVTGKDQVPLSVFKILMKIVAPLVISLSTILVAIVFALIGAKHLLPGLFP